MTQPRHVRTHQRDHLLPYLPYYITLCLCFSIVSVAGRSRGSRISRTSSSAPNIHASSGLPATLREAGELSTSPCDSATVLQPRLQQAAAPWRRLPSLKTEDCLLSFHTNHLNDRTMSDTVNQNHFVSIRNAFV